jgi:hypothetical protein
VLREGVDPPAHPLYRAWPDLIRLPAGGGAEVVYALPERAAEVVGPARLRILLACAGFATLDQHAARIAALGAPLSTAQIRAELDALAASGLLSSASDLVRRLDAAGEAKAGAAPGDDRIALLGIPTRDRVPELSAALSSYIENAQRHGRSPEYVVADDAPAPEGRAATRAALEALSVRYRVPILYAGVEEKERYAAALSAHAGVAPSIVAFAIGNPEGCPFTLGSNQNALLLHGAGLLAVHVDDDTRCRLAPAPGQLAGLSLTSSRDPEELWFPGAGAPDLPDRVVADRDYLGLHEALLGRRVGACAAEARREGLDLEGASGAFFRRLEGTGGRVVCTLTGAAGDSGTGSMWHYLLLADPSRARLLGTEAGYRHAFTGRRVVRVSPRAAISEGGFCMSMSLGLDTRGMFPPFIPAQRNSDGVFGVMLRATRRDAFSGFVPWVIEHAPAQQRASPFEAFFASLGRADCNDLVCALIGASRVEAHRTDPAATDTSTKNLVALGEALERWGSLPLADFEEIVRMEAIRARSAHLVALDDALARHGRAPAFWARDVDRAAAAVRSALARPSVGYPADLVEAFGEDHARPLFQRLLRRYGELCRTWPALYEAAKDLRTRRGVRLATALGAGP